MADMFFGLLQLVSLIFIFTFHNYIRAYTAYRMGDDTPQRLGFLTLNPAPHIDLFGTIILPAIFIFLKSPLIIGWPRMVPINYERFKNRQLSALFLSAVGIAAYFLIAVFAYLLYLLVDNLPLPYNVAIPLETLFQYIVLISTFFGFLNLIPIPPMDMGVILLLLLGKDIYEIHSYSFIGGLIILVLFMSGVLSYLFMPIFKIIQSLF